MKAIMHDGTELNFPDGTDPAVVQATVRKVLASRAGGPNGGQGGQSTGAPGATPTPSAPAAPEGVLNPDGSSDLGDRIKYGLAGVGVQGFLGLKSLYKDLTPEEQNVVAQSKADVEHSGFAGKTANLAGNVAAGIAATIGTRGALPVTAAALAQTGKFAPYLAAALGSGAYTAATSTPDEGSTTPMLDKLAEGGKAAMMGPMAVLGGKAVMKAGTGLFSATKDAIDLMKQGITPTLQQAAASPAGKWIGGLTSGFTNVKNRQEQEVLDRMTQIASGGKVEAPGATLNQRVGQIGASQQQDMTDLMKGKTFPMNNDVRDSALSAADALKLSGGRNVEEQGDARKILDNIIGTDRNPTRLSPDNLQTNYLDRIAGEVSPRNGPLVNSALENARQAIIQKSRNSALTADEQQTLANIEARQSDLAALQNLTAGRGGEKTGVNINKLADQYGAMPDASTNETNLNTIGPLVRTIGDQQRQDESRTAWIIAKRIAGIGTGVGAAGLALTHPLTATVTAPLYGLSALGQSAKGARLLTGQTGPQIALKNAYDSPQMQKLFDLITPTVGSDMVGN